jgi:predicted permease
MRLHARLVTLEMALTTTLLFAGGLLVRSLTLKTRADPAFRPQGLAAIEIRFPLGRYDSIPARESFWRGMLADARNLPGVRSAVTVEEPLPYPSFVLGSKLDVEGQTLTEAEQRSTVAPEGVTPGYFETMGIPVLEGRSFAPEEYRKSDLSVVIINQGAARRLWPGQSALGKQFRWAPRGQYSTVVGTIRDDPTIWNDRPGMVQVRYPIPEYFDSRWGGWLVVRTAPEANETTILGNLRILARADDPAVVVPTVSGVPALLSAQLSSARFTTTLLGVFAGLALVIAGVGLYGVLAYAVSQRTREIGIRMALGAERRSVVGMVVRQGLLPTVVGLALGTAGGVLLSRFFKTLLYDTTGADPLTMAAVVVVLMLAALAASFIPARRAVRVDPVTALRAE